jgi:hypothetical protein
MLLCELAHLEPRSTHLDAERLGLVAAGHSAAVIVAQHDDRLAVELGIENALTGHVEVVDVDESDSAWLHG